MSKSTETDTIAIDTDLEPVVAPAPSRAEAKRLTALIEGPGYAASQLDQVEADRKRAHAQWLANGGEEGEKRRAAEEAQAAQDVIDGHKRSAARLESLRKSVGDAPVWAKESADLDAAIADPKSTVEVVIERWIELRRAEETADRLGAFGNQAIAGQLGIKTGVLREAVPRPSVAEILDRFVAARVDSVVTAAVTGMLNRAGDAWTSAVK